MTAKRFVAHSGTLDNLGWMQSRGFAEAGKVVHYGENPGCGEIRAAGMTATLNILNDATLAQNDINYTATGGDASYIQSIVNNGYSCIAGEGTGSSLVGMIMDYVPYINYGGDQQNEMYSSPWNHPASRGKGHWDYIETYTAGSPSQVQNIGGVEGCINAARSAGAGHLGILIGEWTSAGADTYIQIVDATGCDTICSWGGYDGHSSAKQDIMGQLIDHYGATKAGGGGGSVVIPTYTCPDGTVVATKADCTAAEKIGGSTPAACTPTANTLFLFVRGTTGQLYLKAWQGSSWSKWYDEGGMIGSATGPGAACWGNNRVDVFVGGGGGSVYHKGGTGGSFGPWENLGGVTTADCAAASDAGGNVYVFVRGTDGGLYHKDYWGGKWHGWYSLGGKLLPGTGPTVCSWATGTLDVYVTGTNNNVYHIRTTGGGKWGGWQNLGGATGETPGCAHIGSGEQAVFVRGGGGALYYRAFGGGKWGNWAKIGGVLLSGTGPAVTNFGNKYHVFVAATGGNIDHIIGPPWGGWENLGGNVSGGSGVTPSTGTSTSTGGATPTAVIKIAWKGKTGTANTADANTTVVITGQAGYVDSKGAFVAGKPYTGQLWKWSQQYSGGKGGASKDEGKITPDGKTGVFTWNITDSAAEEVHYNVGFVAGAHGTTATIKGTKAWTETITVPGTATKGTDPYWSKPLIYLNSGECPYCDTLMGDLAAAGIAVNTTYDNNYQFTNTPGLHNCDGANYSSPGGTYEQNAQALISKIRAACYHAGTKGGTSPATKKTIYHPATSTTTYSGTVKPAKWAVELVMKWTAGSGSDKGTGTYTCPDGTVVSTAADCPGGGGGGGGGDTTPTTPSDVTLTPVLPIPTAITEGVTVVLRDHKKLKGANRWK